MKCGLNGLSYRAQVYEQAKTETGSGGFSTSDTLLYSLWAGVDFLGSKEDDSGSRIIRYNEYKVTMRESPIMDTKRAVNKLKFFINSIGAFYPSDFTVANGIVTFTCLDRHED